MVACFLVFRFDKVRHPTIATFIRSTLGIGIVFYPMYVFTIAIGAWRCHRLLEVQAIEDEFNS